jgi:hypothetical protein
VIFYCAVHIDDGSCYFALIKNYHRPFSYSEASSEWSGMAEARRINRISMLFLSSLTPRRIFCDCELSEIFSVACADGSFQPVTVNYWHVNARPRPEEKNRWVSCESLKKVMLPIDWEHVNRVLLFERTCSNPINQCMICTEGHSPGWIWEDMVQHREHQRRQGYFNFGLE